VKRKMYGTTALVLGVAALGIIDSSLAAEVSMMDEVVVTAGRVQETRKDVTSNITVVSREVIKQSTARNVGELLAELGLSHVQKYPGSLTSVAIRGFRTETHGNDLQSHVLVLLDGRRAGTGNMAKLMTKNIERIEIIRGPGAVQYGSGGIGGVINIITRQGDTNSFVLEMGAGTNEEYEGTIGLTVKEKGFDIAGTITGQTIGDYTTGGGLDYVNTAFDSKLGISINGGYTFAEGNRVGMNLTSFSVDEDGNPGYINMPDSDDYTDKDNYSLDLRYDGSSASANLTWMTRYFFGQDENVWGYPTASNPDGWDFDDKASNTTDQQGFQAQVSSSVGPATFTGGFDWVKYEVENTWTPEQTQYDNPALFLLAKSVFLDNRLIADVGLRYDWYDVEVTQPSGGTESDTRLTPSIGLAWMVMDALKLRARYAEGFVMPSADQLAADYWNWGIRTVGNPELDPEKSKTYEGGLDFSKAGFDGSLTFFATDFDDKITNFILSDGSSSWVNLGSATINGFETEMSYDLGVTLNLPIEVRPYLNLTVLTKYEDNETGEDLLYLSDTNYSAGLVVSDGDGWFCRFNFAYTGSQPVQDWASGIYPVPVVNLDSFIVADLSASYRFLESESYGRWSARGEIRNIFDEDYSYVLGNPMPGRTFFAGLRMEY
jgi:vitamin B12 transporter